MKRKFILLAMMLLTLIGGVNLNVLNAQEEDVVTINGDATSYNHNYPIPFNSSYGLCQVTYTETEINHASGFISNIALKIDVDRERSDIAFYLQNTTETTLSTWIPFSDSDRVFYSNSFSTSEREDGWLSITLDNSFEYTGGNILLTVWDNSGSATYTYNNGCAYKGNSGRNSMLYKFDSNPVSTSSACNTSTRQPAIKFYFAEQTDDIVPAAPNLVATTVDYKSVNLTWDVAENALKYQVWQGENMIAETDQTEYLVEGLSDGTEYCFTVKSVRYNNTSDASNESCATTAVLPVPATPANLTATNITHNSVTLTWDAVEYAESYTVSYTGGTITVTENTCDVTGLTPETDYTFSVTANNTKGSSSAAEVSATTLEYNDPFAGKLFRIKVNSGNTNGVIGKYLNIFSYNKNSATNMSSVGAKDKADTEYQKFIIESAGNGNYYLKNTAGYYIKCAQYNVDAFSTTEKTALTFEYVSGSDGPFYLRDSEYTGDKTNNYFKAEFAYEGDFAYNYHVYCDQPITNTYVVTWTLEEVVLSATATTESNSIYDDQTTTLSVTAMDGSGNYTYSWSPANGLSDATSANPTFTPTAAGEHTFTCTVTDTESNATTEASVTVYVYARPTLYFTVYADKELIYNDGETAVLTATVTEGTGYAPYTYSWTLNETEVGTEATYTFSNTTVGEYTLTCTVTDARNNTQTASKTIEVKDASERPKTRNIVFTLKDSFGDTWNGGYLTVTATDGTNESLQMLTGSYSNKVYEEQYTLQIAEGAVVTVTFTPGSYSYECSYCIDYEGGDNIICSESYGLVNGSNIYTFTVEPNLPKVSNLHYTDEEGNVLDDVIMEGTIYLVWDEVENVTSYKVYKQNHLGEIVDEPVVVENNSFEIYAERNIDGVKYGVSTIFDDEESAVVYTELTKVIGEGVIKGVVTDGTNPISDIVVYLEGTSLMGEEIVPDMTTNELGEFEFNVTEGTYTLSVSHHDYEKYVMENVEIIFSQPTDLGTIALTAKPEITGVTVTADNNGNVSWTGDYAKWNVYRRNMDAPQELTSVARELTTTSTTDTEWETLEPGTYQYGVAPLEDNTNSFIQGFNDGALPEGWTQSNSHSYTIENKYTWAGTTLQYTEGRGSVYFYYYGNTSGCEHRLISPAIDLGTSGNATLKFKYYIWSNYGSSYSNKLSVRVATSPEGPWNDVVWNDSYYTGQTWQNVECTLPYTGTVYVAFSTTLNYCYTYLDAVEITAGSLYENKIVWSNDVVKQGPNTFEGTVSTDWNVPGNWSHGNVPATGDEVIVNAEAVISGNVELSALDIVGNGSVTVDANASLTVTGEITQEKYYSLIMNDGAQVFQNNANVTAQFNMNLVNPSDWSTSNKDGWQFISSPLSNVSVTNIAEGNYDLYKYDGDAESELEWLNHKDENFAETTYQHHIGYLASHETMSTLEFKGTLNYNDYQGSYAFYDLVEYYENEPLKNFYLIGNPYPFNISWADFKNNKGMVNGYAYVKEDGNYGYATSGEIAVGDGFFVQAISGTPDDPYSTYYYYVKGSGNTKSTRESNNSLNITATGNAGEDNVIINLAGKSEGFDKLQNFNDAIATVYVAEDGKNYGIYNCDADVQEVELSFNANQMGNYTISIEPNGKFQTVTLVDRFTGIETNMLVEDYHFTAMSNVNTNRFIIKMVNGQESTDNSHFVYQSGEDLIIDAEGTVQIIDVMGRVLVSDEVESTNNRINVSGFQNGTYMVRVINGSEVKVEKVVIY